MTLLNTFANLGDMWPSSLSLWAVDQITVKQCEAPAELSPSPLQLGLNQTWSQAENSCYGALLKDQCESAGGECTTIQEGFYTLSIIWAVIGAVWFVWGFRTIRQFQSLDPKEWRVVDKPVREEREREEKFKYFYCF